MLWCGTGLLRISRRARQRYGLLICLRIASALHTTYCRRRQRVMMTSVAVRPIHPKTALTCYIKWWNGVYS